VPAAVACTCDAKLHCEMLSGLLRQTLLCNVIDESTEHKHRVGG